MALPNFDRILFVDDSDNIYNDSSNKSTLFSFMSSYGFNGMYLFDAQNYITSNTNWNNFSSFLSQSYSNGITIKGITYGDTSLISSINSYNSASGSTAAKKIDRFDLYNDYWDGGDNWDTWSTNLQSISSSLDAPSTVDFYMGYYQDTGSKILPINEVQAAKLQLQNSKYVLFSIFEKGIPLYSTANDKKSTNTFSRLDTIAQAAFQLNTTASLYFYIHAGEQAWGSGGDYSGYSIHYAGSFDIFEDELMENVVNRMTAFQKKWVNVKGFAYYNRNYLYQALTTGSIPPPPPPSGSIFYRVLKVNNVSSWLGITAQENVRLNYYQNHGINWIQFYGLNSLNWSSWSTGSGAVVTATAGRLKYFIERARTQYSVLRVGGIRSANNSKFQEMFDYNADGNITSANQQFDDFNIENEFWFWPYTGAHPEARPFSDTENTMQYIRNQIDNVYSKTGEWVLSAYIQNYKQSSGTAVRWAQPYVTASILCTYLDVYEATNYNSGAPNEAIVSTSGSGNQGKFEQINFIASASFELGKTQSFVPIISAETSFAGPWLGANGIVAGETIWTASYTADSLFAHKSNLLHIGYNYFAYNDLSSYVP